jgi:hypothetical protein
MSQPYDRRPRRSPPAIPTARRAFGYWIPLVVTVTIATFGIAAWVWSERQDDEDENDPGYGENLDGSTRSAPPTYGSEPGPGEAVYGTMPEQSDENSSYMARMSGALRRTPSPQQFLDSASRTVAAGVASAGAVVSNALSSIREEDREVYRDHETWSEEAESRRVQEQGNALANDGHEKSRSTDVVRTGSSQPLRTSTTPGNGKRKTVAVVVSADTTDEDGATEAGYRHERAVCEVHILRVNNTDINSLFYPIYQRKQTSPRSVFLSLYIRLILKRILLILPTAQKNP